MKKPFALFCALCLMPTFSAQAWVGGPFSNNTFFEPGGDDGVYEASATAINGIGLYRFSVGNNFDGVNPQGVNASVPSQNTVTPGQVVTIPGIASGNIVIGGLGNAFSNIWFYQGVQYFGTTLGTANSAMGRVMGFGSARNGNGLGNVTLESSFRGSYVQYSKLLPATAFRGVGNAFVSTGQRFRFTVFGNRVSNRITFGL